MKRILIFMLGFTLLFAPRPAAAVDDLSSDDVEEVKSNLNCLKILHKRYCAALDQFKTGGPPKTDPLTIYVGSTFTRVYKNGMPSLSEEVGYLVVGKDGTMYGPLDSETIDDRKKTDDFLAYLQENKPVPASNALLKAIQGLKATDELLQRRSAKLVGKSLHFSDEAADISRRIYIREVKDALVVVQVAIQYGIDPNVSKLPIHVGVFRKENKKSF
jgi:hypothetical protein